MSSAQLIPKEHVSVLMKIVLKTMERYLKDPKCVGCTIRYSPRCSDEAIILLNTIPTVGDYYRLEIVICLCVTSD